MSDFLTFKSFISPSMLVIFYYMGVLILPIFLWQFSTHITAKNHWIDILHKKGKHLAWKLLSKKQRITVFFVFLSVLIMMELIWRMIFEFLIAYMQIRDVLMHSSVMQP